ncbi:MAG: Fur family transcriptional regulator [Candidatus Spechtbacterales bacterium]
MVQKKQILKNLKQRGHRITKVRSAMLDVFENAKKPLLAAEISASLKGKGIYANKTTVYRQIDFLKEERVIKEIDFGDLQRRYELAGTDHHHHAVCVYCGDVEEVELSGDLKSQEKKISQDYKFKVLHHKLEFFGICRKCNN